VRAFFDANILVYVQEVGGKGAVARDLLAGGGGISVQVLDEFVSVSLRKQALPWSDIEEAVEDILILMEKPLALTLGVHEAARRLAREHRFAFYDALILAAAIEAGWDRLYSVDLQHGCAIAGLTILNPFIEDVR
jgi:predicted nucleic acid-binding protein